MTDKELTIKLRESLDLMLTILNELHLHRGDMPQSKYIELSRRIIDLYKQVI